MTKDISHSQEQQCLQAAHNAHLEWLPGPAEIAAAGGSDRRSAKNADRPINQWCEAQHPARPLHSPEGASRPPRGWNCGCCTVDQVLLPRGKLGTRVTLRRPVRQPAALAHQAGGSCRPPVPGPINDAE
jgi:hypothetical protein